MKNETGKFTTPGRRLRNTSNVVHSCLVPTIHIPRGKEKEREREEERRVPHARAISFQPRLILKRRWSRLVAAWLTNNGIDAFGLHIFAARHVFHFVSTNWEMETSETSIFSYLKYRLQRLKDRLWIMEFVKLDCSCSIAFFIIHSFLSTLFGLKRKEYIFIISSHAKPTNFTFAVSSTWLIRNIITVRFLKKRMTHFVERRSNR